MSDYTFLKYYENVHCWKTAFKTTKKNIYTQKAKIEHWYQKWFLENAKRLKIQLKFIYSEKATKFCEILTLLLTGTTSCGLLRTYELYQAVIGRTTGSHQNEVAKAARPSTLAGYLKKMNLYKEIIIETDWTVKEVSLNRTHIAAKSELGDGNK